MFFEMERCTANICITVIATEMDASFQVVGFVLLDTVLSMQQYPDKLPTDREFRKVEGNPKQICLHVSFINICDQMSWTKVKLKIQPKKGRRQLCRTTEKAPMLNEHRSDTDIIIMCKIQMST